LGAAVAIRYGNAGGVFIAALSFKALTGWVRSIRQCLPKIAIAKHRRKRALSAIRRKPHQVASETSRANAFRLLSGRKTGLRQTLPELRSQPDVPKTLFVEELRDTHARIASDSLVAEFARLGHTTEGH